MNNSGITRSWNKSRIFRHFGPRVPLRQFYGHVTSNLFTVARFIDSFHYLTNLGNLHLIYCRMPNPHEQSSQDSSHLRYSFKTSRWQIDCKATEKGKNGFIGQYFNWESFSLDLPQGHWRLALLIKILSTKYYLNFSTVGVLQALFFSHDLKRPLLRAAGKRKIWKQTCLCALFGPPLSIVVPWL